MGFEHQLVLSKKWISENLVWLDKRLRSFETFVNKTDAAYTFLGTETHERGHWGYDLRLFLEEEGILVEISAQTLSIENDLEEFEKDLDKVCGFTKRDV